jgi:predicted ester cyclase
VDRYIANDYIRHDPGLPAEVRGPEGIKQLVPMYRAAFPDIHFTAADVLAEGIGLSSAGTFAERTRGNLWESRPPGER